MVSCMKALRCFWSTCSFGACVTFRFHVTFSTPMTPAELAVTSRSSFTLKMLIKIATHRLVAGRNLYTAHVQPICSDHCWMRAFPHACVGRGDYLTVLCHAEVRWTQVASTRELRSAAKKVSCCPPHSSKAAYNTCFAWWSPIQEATIV